ncbi:MAG: PEP-CTERM sorting domain-containing protein [Leptothrix sp. (in: b-proteobacteria)]
MKLTFLAGCIICFAAASSAQAAPVTQSFTGGAADVSNWRDANLGSVTLAQGTNNISSLTTSAIFWDQGWGGQDAWNNRADVQLFSGNTLLWDQRIGGGDHSSYGITQTFNITSTPASFSALNTALGTINWSSAPAVTLQINTVNYGYPGWQLHVRDASLNVTSNIAAPVPEPESYAMLMAGLGVLGWVGRRRRAARAA